MCGKYGVNGYPTIKAFSQDDKDGQYIPRSAFGATLPTEIVEGLLKLNEKEDTEESAAAGGEENEADQSDREDNDETEKEEKEEVVDEPTRDDEKEVVDEATKDESKEEKDEATKDDEEASTKDNNAEEDSADRVSTPATTKASSLADIRPKVHAPFVADAEDLARVATTGFDPTARPGAIRASMKANDMDKWQELLEKRKKIVQERMVGRKNGLLRKPNGGGETLAKAGESGETDTMKAHTPGNDEFAARRQRIIDQIGRKSSSNRLGLPAIGRHGAKLGDSDAASTKQFPYKVNSKKPGFLEKRVENVPVIKRLVKPMSADEAIILDVSLSFVQGLKDGLALKTTPLTSGEKSALVDWFDLLSVGLPQDWGLHDHIDLIRSRIDSIGDSKTPYDALLRVLGEKPLPRNKWSRSCDQFGLGGGFTCGLWKLLHVVSIGVAEHRGGLNLSDTHRRSFSPGDAADVIANYLKRFFTCEPCRDHFLQLFKKCAYRRCERLNFNAEEATADDWKQLALWLWEVHNDVNVRVLKDRVTNFQQAKGTKTLFSDPNSIPMIAKTNEIEVIYPDIENCLPCLEDGTGRWHENSVFAFLERTYWGLPDVNEKLIVLDKSGGQDGTAGGFIWFLLLGALAVVFIVRNHLRMHSAFQNLGLPQMNMDGVRNKLGDAIGGKKRTA